MPETVEDLPPETESESGTCLEGRDACLHATECHDRLPLAPAEPVVFLEIRGVGAESLLASVLHPMLESCAGGLGPLCFFVGHPLSDCHQQQVPLAIEVPSFPNYRNPEVFHRSRNPDG